MATIDTSLIEGYSEMTAEEKVAALEALEYEDHAAEAERYKKAVDKASSDAAAWKKKHNALLSDEDKRAQEAAEKYQQMEAELAELRRDKAISDHKVNFLALGYDEELASSTAVAMADGDIATVFANQKKYIEAHDKALKADLLRNTPAMRGGGGDQPVDYSKQVSEAYARGDEVTALAYMRQSQENNT